MKCGGSFAWHSHDKSPLSDSRNEFANIYACAPLAAMETNVDSRVACAHRKSYFHRRSS